MEVDADVARPQAARQNAAFFTFMRYDRPFVVFKAAVSLDGRIAASPGIPTPISGAEAHRETQRLRAEVDAIAVGSGTLLADDPWLTVRDVYRQRPFTRVVLPFVPPLKNTGLAVHPRVEFVTVVCPSAAPTSK